VKIMTTILTKRCISAAISLVPSTTVLVMTEPLARDSRRVLTQTVLELDPNNHTHKHALGGSLHSDVVLPPAT